jgi:hypothetical protein
VFSSSRLDKGECDILVQNLFLQEKEEMLTENAVWHLSLLWNRHRAATVGEFREMLSI